MKRMWLVLMLSLVILTMPFAIWAQDEGITLEDLATQPQDFRARLEYIEALWEGPGPVSLQDGICGLGSAGGIQDATVLKYKDTFDAWLNLDRINLVSVTHDPERGTTGITYEEWIEDCFFTEVWEGCTYVETTDWWED